MATWWLMSSPVKSSQVKIYSPNDMLLVEKKGKEGKFSSAAVKRVVQELSRATKAP